MDAASRWCGLRMPEDQAIPLPPNPSLSGSTIIRPSLRSPGAKAPKPLSPASFSLGACPRRRSVRFVNDPSGQRILGIVRLADNPASGEGRHYVIERELVTMAELEAIVSDYLQQAQTWDTIPAVGPCYLLADFQEPSR